MTARSSEPITEQLTYMSRHHITKSLGEAKGCNFSFCSTGISFRALFMYHYCNTTQDIKITERRVVIHASL